MKEVMSSYILEINDLRKVYDSFVLQDISFDLPKGYIMGLIGQNGAGKTTTIKLLMNIIKADSGQVRIFGQNYNESETDIKNRIGYVGEEQNYYDEMSVVWTERFFANFYTDWNSLKFYQLLELFNVNKSKKIKELSKGMKVKLSIALALAHSPDLLILDEPTSALDPIVRREILDVLLDFIQDESKSVLFSSHITEDIEKIADYVTYIDNGKIILSEEKEKIKNDWKKIHFKSETEIGDIKNYIICKQENPFGVSGIIKNYTQYESDLQKLITKGAVKIENLSLDDILVAIAKEGKKCII